MGLRGPAPKPRALAIAEGNPGKRPLNDGEPEPRRKRPKCPDYLDEEAKREWRRLVPILERMRVLTEADGLALAGLCMQYSTMVKAQRLLEKSGLLFKTRSGYVQQSPLVAVVAGSLDQVTKHCRDFGLTPSSRTRLSVEKENDSDDGLWDLLSSPRLPTPDLPPLQ